MTSYSVSEECGKARENKYRQVEQSIYRDCVKFLDDVIKRCEQYQLMNIGNQKIDFLEMYAHLRKTRNGFNVFKELG